MPIELPQDEVVVIPATEAKTYNLLYLDEIKIDAYPDNSGHISGYVKYHPYYEIDGVKYFAPSDTITTETISDLFAEGQTTPELLQAFGAIVVAAQAFKLKRIAERKAIEDALNNNNLVP